MSRALVIPAAGTGSRLGADQPKALVSVAGRPMLAWLLDLYGPLADDVVLVVRPGDEHAVRAALADLAPGAHVAHQVKPTGMLDALLVAAGVVRELPAREVWITWCDQIAVRRETVERLAQAVAEHPAAAAVVPTVMRNAPYIHFERDGSGRLVVVRQAREGDPMPARGESDMGLFVLDRAAFVDDLVTFGREAGVAAGTGERNFLPFLPWLAHRRRVVTVPGGDDIEALGVNTPAELARIEAVLRDAV